jgi:peptidoglycan/LPS O-acetylase OafA/YrhL
MGIPLASFTGGRDNNFNLLRFAAALLVMYSHSFALAWDKTAVEPLAAITDGALNFGKLGVEIFFVISGFLVTGSLLQRQSILGFCWARILRIYPALLAAVLFCVFTVGVVFTTLPPEQYLTDPQLKAFIIVNSSLWDSYYELPGVFVDNPYKKAVNGSLWTLPYEIRMYIALGCLWIFSRRFFGTLVAMAAAIAIITHLILVGLHGKPTELAHIARLGSFFALGSLFYVLRERIPLSTGLFCVSLLLMSAVAIDPLFYPLRLIGLPYAALFLAYVPNGPIRAFNRLGDYSYGLYIYAFPIQQSVAALWKGVQPYPLFGVSFAISLLLATLSWHWLEHPALRLKAAYRWWPQWARP